MPADKPTEDQRKRLQAWASENMPKGQCPWCAGGDWLIGEIVVFRAYVAGKADLLALPIRCEQCGYIRFHDVRQMGYPVDT